MRQRLQAWLDFRLGTSAGARILGAGAVVAVLSGLARLVAVARDLVLAAQFGLGPELDVLFVALMLYQVVIGVFVGSASAAFLPTYVGVRGREGPAAAHHLLRGVGALGALVLLAMTLLVVGGAGLYLPWLAPGFDAAQLALGRHLVWLLAPLLLLSGATTLWGAVVNAGGRFAVPALTPGLNAAIGIAALLLFGPAFGVVALAAGMALGAVAEAAILAWFVRRRGVPLWPSWRRLHGEIRRVGAEYGAALGAAAMMASTLLIDTAMASWLGDAEVATLNLGSKVVGFVLLLAANSLATAAIPYASEVAASGGAPALKALADRFLVWLLPACLPAVALLVMLAEPVTALLFQRGAFTAADTARVAPVQAVLALQIPFYVASVLLLRFIAALRANAIIFQGAVINCAVNVVGNLVFMRFWGVAGIALSTVLVYVVSLGFLYWRLRRLAAAGRTG